MGSIRYRTLRENVADAIRMKILNQQLKPGDRIVEMELAKEFGVSRGPVREALRQLENEGLVEYVRNVGCSVKNITVADSYEIYLMRTGYETMAVKMFDGIIPEETIRNMDLVLEKMKHLDIDHYEHIFTCDNELHGELVKMVHLPRLYKAWEQLSYGNVITGYGQDLDKERVVSRQYLLHKNLVDACRTGNPHVICKEISDHYMKTINWLLEDQGISEEESEYSLDFLL